MKKQLENFFEAILKMKNKKVIVFNTDEYEPEQIKEAANSFAKRENMIIGKYEDASQLNDQHTLFIIDKENDFFIVDFNQKTHFHNTSSIFIILVSNHILKTNRDSYPLFLLRLSIGLFFLVGLDTDVYEDIRLSLLSHTITRNELLSEEDRFALFNMLQLSPEKIEKKAI